MVSGGSLTLSFAVTSLNNLWTNGSLSLAAHSASTSDTFTGTSVTLGDGGIMDGGTFSNVSLAGGAGRTIQNSTFSGGSISGNTVWLFNITLNGTSVSVSHILLLDSTVQGGGISTSGMGHIENNTVTNASVSIGAGVIKNNTVIGGSLTVSNSSVGFNAEVSGNTVSGATNTGITINSSNIFLAKNQVSSSDIGIKLSQSALQSVRSYGNVLTNNRIGVQWLAGCSGACNITASHFKITGSTQQPFYGQYISGGLVELSLLNSWWDSVDSVVLKFRNFDRFDSSTGASEKVGLYFSPWASGPLATADADNDGIVDAFDGDDDNDGVCDLQEARASRLDLNPPLFFNPIDASSKPSGTPDCDNDGIDDNTDIDDDNDGLIDTVEATLDTNPFDADTDGDGVSDLAEYNASSDPLDNNSIPSIVPVPVPVPDTGQTTSYTNTFGEDADYSENPMSFTDNGNGTITDNVTGLLWQKQDDGVGRDWDTANTYCEELPLAGYTDWKLPAVSELTSIVNYGRSSPAINTTYFPSTSSDYWSSAVYANGTSYA
ncbi:DUF1566 domain-containing protein [Deltaproteobacteria bacterium TL4]